MDHKQGRKLGDSDFLDFHGQIWFGLLNLNYKFLLQSTESFTISLNQFFFPCCHKREMYLYNLFYYQKISLRINSSLRRKKISLIFKKILNCRNVRIWYLEALCWYKCFDLMVIMKCRDNLWKSDFHGQWIKMENIFYEVRVPRAQE